MELLDYLRSSWATCTRCNLHKTRKQVVFGSGSPTAKLVIIGEAPGETEDETGIPFGGQSGELLDKAIKQIGLMRRQLFITNSVCCHPPGNREPKSEEQIPCWNRLVNTIDIIQPKCLLIVGKQAAERILGRTVVMSKERGTRGCTSIGETEIMYVLALHPSHILRLGATKKLRDEFAGDIRRAWDIAKGWDDEDEIPW